MLRIKFAGQDAEVHSLGELTQVWANDQLLYQNQISPIPGCPYVGIISRVWLAPHLRGKGLGKELHVGRLNSAKSRGMSFVMCTVASHNKREIHILDENDWQFKSVVKAMGEYSVYLYGKSL